MSLKSQTVLESLVTYGWAILIVLIVVGLLNYFGVLSFSTFLPEKCSFGSEVVCVDYVIHYATAGEDGTTGQVNFKLSNNLEEDIEIDSVSIKTESALPYVEPGKCQISFNPTGKWKKRTEKNFISTPDCNSDNAQFSVNKKGKILVTIEYHEIGASEFVHEVQGEILGSVI